MKTETIQTDIASEIADAVVVGVWKNLPLAGSAAELNAATEGLISRLIESEEISTNRYSVTILHRPVGIQSPIVAVVGLGDQSSVPSCLAFRTAAAATKMLATKGARRVSFFLDDLASESAVAGAMTGCVGQDIYRQEKKLFPIDVVAWSTADENTIKNGQTIGESINLTRRLVNMPANEIFPESFAEQCERTGRESGFKVEVWDEDRLHKEKCGALLAVARASDRPPRLVIMRYTGGRDSDPILGLVGKGVTFDSGGLSLKPSPSMLAMKCDMAGAATVLGAMKAIAQLKLPVNVIGFVGLAENMISGSSYRLGDVLTARSGKTIEVHNTDAEGRLVLADTLDVACQAGASSLIDLATLTGACVVALGQDIVGLMSNNQEWANSVSTAAESSGEQVWQLPMHEEFAEQIKSNVADIKNVGDGRWGGTITAGKFLEEFVQGLPWVHLDIAGPSFAEKPSGWIDGGASGCMVQTLIRVAKDWQTQ